MARFHVATLTPTKAELLAAWVPTQPWGPPAGDTLEVLGSFRFDDPDGRVGMETHLVVAGGVVFQVPLTYRDEALADGVATLIGEMEHSVLGTRWVYDGLSDPIFTTMLAAVAMTGQGEALGLAIHEDRWYVAPANVRIRGGGWGLERVPVDGFSLGVDGALRNDRFEVVLHRRPVAGTRPPIGLTASWDDGPEVVLAEVRDTLA
jgi:hypothetical protein